MEFERAVYRVYDRSLDVMIHDQPFLVNRPFTKPSIICHFCLHAVWTLAITLLGILWVLHINFVGHPGCILSHLEHIQAQRIDAAGGLPVASSNKYVRFLTREEGHNSSHSMDKSNITAFPLMEKDEILQIRILPRNDGADSSDQWGRKKRRKRKGRSALQANQTSSFMPDYIFVQDMALLYLDPQFWYKHSVKVTNISVDEWCVTKNPALAFLVHTLLDNYDTILINQLMFSLRDDGTLRNTHTNETWSWYKESLPPLHGYTWQAALFHKIQTIFRSLLAFFLLSCVTALIVRMLLSSGVVLMYPIFYCLRHMGFRGLDMNLLTLSYPWLGLNIQQLRRRNKPITPFILAHVCYVIVYYSMYEACQIFWIETIYNKSVPNGLQFEIYGLMMLLEYFALIYCRSPLAIRYFPRISLLYLLLFHFYFYESLYGFFGLMLAVTFLLIAHAMIYTILILELPACRSSTISMDNPRAYFNDTAVPTWGPALPPSWSLFLALNTAGRIGGVYSEEVPSRPRRGGGGDNGGGYAASTTNHSTSSSSSSFAMIDRIIVEMGQDGGRLFHVPAGSANDEETGEGGGMTTQGDTIIEERKENRHDDDNRGGMEDDQVWSPPSSSSDDEGSSILGQRRRRRSRRDTSGGRDRSYAEISSRQDLV